MSTRGVAPLLAALAVLGAVTAVVAEEPGAAAVRRVATPPLGLPAVPVPADNPVTAAKVELGRKLFFDRRLSPNGTMSCAMNCPR